jgi:3-oxoacyl-[acyl-carrier protein] reductase
MRIWELTLKGKIAVVTGGAQGIGRAISLGMGCSGATVCIADIDLEAAEDLSQQIRSMGQQSLAVQVDARDSRQIAAAVEKIVRAFGRIDVLSNNAGGANGFGFRMGRIGNITEKDWDETITLNLKTVFLWSRAVAPVMLQNRSGSIINMASITGEYPWAGMPAYSAAKAAIINFTKELALELAPHIRVNALAPGLIETARTSKNRGPEQLAQLLSNVPLGRMGKPEEVADLVIYLASEVAGYMTGTIIDCNGGQAWMTEVGRPSFRDASLLTAK